MISSSSSMMKIRVVVLWYEDASELWSVFSMSPSNSSVFRSLLFELLIFGDRFSFFVEGTPSFSESSNCSFGIVLGSFSGSSSKFSKSSKFSFWTVLDSFNGSSRNFSRSSQFSFGTTLLDSSSGSSSNFLKSSNWSLGIVLIFRCLILFL